MVGRVLGIAVCTDSCLYHAAVNKKHGVQDGAGQEENTIVM